VTAIYKCDVLCSTGMLALPQGVCMSFHLNGMVDGDIYLSSTF
jgi:hypothetical protein